MKKMRFLITLLMATAMMAMSPQKMWAEITQPSVGDGTAASPYKIGTADELLWFMTEASKATSSNETKYYAELTADIVVNQNVLNADGTLNGTPAITWVMPDRFYGIFDGKNHTISGIYHPDNSNDGCAMFKTNEGTIRNLGVLDSYFGAANKYHGATFAAYNFGTVTDCYSFATIVGSMYCGGIVADCTNSEISNCFYAGKMTSTVEYSGPICSDYNGMDKTSTSVHNNYFLASSLNSGMKNVRSTSVTLDEMKSGKVAILLQAGRATTVWGQTLSGSDKQDYPILGGATVYASKLKCDGKTPTTEATYSNSSAVQTIADHDYVNGVCSVCGTYQVSHTGDGTAAHPYLIARATDLKWFCDTVNSLTGDVALCAKLTADIDFTSFQNTMVTANYKGTFDGDGHKLTVSFNRTADDAAFFQHLYGTVKRLTVAGTITTSKKYAAGIAAHAYGATISQCTSEVNIVSTISGDGTHAGFVATLEGGYTNNTIEDCVFRGSISGSSTNSCGGIIGWSQAVSTKIKNTLMAATISCSLTDCNTFSRNPQNVTCTNCYYTTAMNATPSGATKVTADELKSGKVAALLQAGRSDATVWGQTLSGENKQDYPVLGGATVYATSLTCNGTPAADATYSNSLGDQTRAEHSFANGVCSVCGKHGAPATGNGTSANPYLISNNNEYLWLQEQAADTCSNGKTYYVKFTKSFDFGSDTSKTLCFAAGTWNIDLNSKNLWFRAESVIKVNGAQVTIDDSSAYQNGYVGGANFPLLYVSGKLTVKSGNFNGMNYGMKIDTTDLTADAVTLRGGRFAKIFVTVVSNWSKINMTGYEYVDLYNDKEVAIPTTNSVINTYVRVAPVKQTVSVGSNNITVAAGYYGSTLKFTPASTAFYSFAFSGDNIVDFQICKSNHNCSYDLAGKNTYKTSEKLTADSTYYIYTRLDSLVRADQAITLTVAEVSAPSMGTAITADTTVNIASVPAHSQVVYSITPAKSGVYSIAYDSDVEFYPYHAVENGYESMSSPSEMIYYLKSGETYRIVGTNHTDSVISSSNLSVKYDPLPVISETQSATIDSIGYCDQVIYKFVAPKSKAYIFSISNNNLSMSPYTDSLLYFNNYNTNYNSNGLSISFETKADSTYYVCVANWYDSTIKNVTVKVSSFDSDSTALVEGKNRVYIQEYDTISYTFIPQHTGLYRFYSAADNSYDDLDLLAITHGSDTLNMTGANSEEHYLTDNCDDFCWTTTDTLYADSTYLLKIYALDEVFNYKVVAEWLDPDLIEIGEKDDDTDCGAYYNDYCNSTTITLYKGSEIGKSGSITEIAYNVCDTTDIFGGFGTTELKIYMMQTEKTDLNTYDDIDVDDFTLVYSGTPVLGKERGWENVMLDTSFSVDTTKNLLVAVSRKSPYYDGDLEYYCTNDDYGDTRMIYYDSDSDPGYGELSSFNYMLDNHNIYTNSSYTDIRLAFMKTYATYTLEDGIAYSGRMTTVDTLTYKRSFTDEQVGNWQALYVPFQMEYADWSEDFDVATIQNFHEYSDENGVVVNTVLEVRYVKSGKLKANHPYLIRPKSAGDKTITLCDVTLFPSQSKSITCQSMERKYTFTGTYQPMTDLATNDYLFMTGGTLKKAEDDSVELKAQRWYLSIEGLGSQVEAGSTPQAASSIRISVIGDDDEVTGIEEIKAITSPLSEAPASVFDLQGMRRQSLGKGINIIRQQDGSVKKVIVK